MCPNMLQTDFKLVKLLLLKVLAVVTGSLCALHGQLLDR